jgi:dienelactone hydrolase
MMCLSAGLVIGLSATSGPQSPRGMPPPASLPVIAELPDPFLKPDGTRIESRREWPAQRKRLLETILYYEYGPLPPKGAKVTGEVLSSRQVEGVGTVREVLMSMGPRGAVKVRLMLAVPPGKGPFPVVLDGDLGWGRLDDRFIEAVLSRGYVLAAFNREEVGPDSAERKGVYEAWPDYDGGRLAAWAWGFHRTLDYLCTLPEVDRKRVAVTGHSRGGKCALLAGATDERIAVTAPNNSGCGGAGNFRFYDDKCETLEAIVKAFPYWFHERFAAFRGQVNRLPFDQHTLKACVAPRALLTTEALGDLWANPMGTQQTYQAAREVYAWLGVPDRIGIHFRPGPHEHNLDDFGVLLDFCDKQFFGKETGRRFDVLAFPDARRVWSWTPPSP